jgi:transcriptional regulator with XRE-family HTH domain
MNYQLKIKHLRELRNYTQEHMAHCLGLTQRAYSSIENGKTQLTIERLREITQILNVSIGDILELESKTTYNNNFNNHAAENKGSLIFKQDDIDELKNLYDRIIKGKDDEIQFLRTQMELINSKK